MTAAILHEVDPATQPQAVRFTISRTQGVVLDEPRRALGFNWQDVLLDEFNRGTVGVDEARYLLDHAQQIDAELDAAVTPQPACMISHEYRPLDAWVPYSHLVRSQKRARKSPATCRRCAKLGRRCWQHQEVRA